MEFFIILFLIIFFIFIWPICKVIWRGYRLQKRWQEATAGMRDSFARQQRAENRPPQKKKKIDPSVGEYVAFEEISCDTTIETKTDEKGNTTVKVESQIEDATWEEIR